MRKIFFLLLLEVAFNFVFGQRTIILESGPIEYQEIDGVVVDEYPLDLADNNCSSVSFSVDFGFSQDWIGTGNMESCDECIGCPCDPSDPSAAGCNPSNGCWDFMWIEFLLDGNTIDEKLIGGPVCLDQFGTALSGPYCTDGADEVAIRITNQNWTAAEINIFENVEVDCWGEPTIDTNSPICEGQDLELQGGSNDDATIDEWLWENDGNGAIDDDGAQETFATDSEEGEIYTLTVEDENSCTTSTEIEVAFAAGFTAELCCNDIIICGDGCADEDNYFEIELSGGVEPYTVDLLINGFFPVTIPSITIDETIIQICIGLDVPEPGDPTIVYIPSFVPFPLDIEIEAVVDDTGCNGNVDNATITIDTQELPVAEEPDTEPFCLEEGETIDLTLFDDEVLDGNAGDVIWYDNDDEDDDINDPSEHDPDDANPVYYRIFEDPCYSEFNELDLDVRIKPAITPLETMISNCGFFYELPEFDELVDIENEAGPEYYLDEDLSDGPYSPEDIVEIDDGDLLYIYDESTTDCGDTISIELELIEAPIIEGPVGPLEECGQIQLPEVEVEDADDVEYNTEEDGEGDTFLEGAIITEDMNISALYIYATNVDGCTDELEIELSFLPGVNYIADVPRNSCDSLILPVITPPSPNVGYFTGPEGTGDKLEPGDIIGFDINNIGVLIQDTLYLFDPTQPDACAGSDTIIIEIIKTPRLNIPFQRDFCDVGFLPPNNSGSNPNLEYATTPDFLPGSFLDPVDPITEDVTVYMRDSIAFLDGNGACYVYEQFDLTVSEAPFAGNDTTISICLGFDSFTFNLFELLGNPEQGGNFTIDNTIPDLDLNDMPIAIDFSSAELGSYEILYTIEPNGCPPASSSIFIEIVPEPSIPVFNTQVSTCDLDQEFDLEELLGFPDPGGSWFAIAPGGMQVPIVDSTAFTISSIQGVLPAGTITVFYAIEESLDNPFCIRGFGSIDFMYGVAPNAGSDISTSICSGLTIDLTTLLSSDADIDGVFESSDGSIVIFGSDWNTNIIMPEPEYEIWYIQESPGCPPDTAVLTVALSDQLSAGTFPDDLTVCVDDEIDLFDFITDESPGGEFYFTDDLNTAIDPIWVGMGDRALFTYIIPAAPGCDADTLDFFINVEMKDQLEIIPPVIIESCDNNEDCFSYLVSTSFDGIVQLIITDSETITSVVIDLPVLVGDNELLLCPSDLFATDLQIDTFYIGQSPDIVLNLMAAIPNNNNSCIDIDLLSEYTITRLPTYEETVTQQVCAGEPAIINGITYTSSVDTLLLTTAGCDSLVHVILDTFPGGELIVNEGLCTGQDYPIAGMVFTEDTDTLITIANGSTFGCDSTISLSLSFTAVARGLLDTTLCIGGSIEIDGVTFDGTNMEAEVPAPNSVFGCDSVTQVRIAFYDEVTFDLIDEICSNETYPVGDDTYDANTLTGITTLPGQAANGCDSIINVTLMLLQPDTDQLPVMACAGQDIDILGETYTVSTVPDSIILLNMAGCDSLVYFIDLELELPESELLDVAYCSGQDVIILGETYNDATLPDSIILQDIEGCDSLIYYIETSDLQAVTESIQVVFCGDKETEVLGESYTISTLPDSILLSTTAGCDSLIYYFDIEEIDIQLLLAAVPFCEGNTPQLILAQAIAPLPYELYLNGVLFMTVDQPDTVFPITLEGILGMNTLMAVSDDCRVEENIEIVSAAELDLDLITTETGDNTYSLSFMTAAIVSEISWSATTDLDCNDCEVTTVSITEDTEVFLELLTADGCTLSGSTTLIYQDEMAVDSTIIIYESNLINVTEGQDDLFYVQANVSTTIDRLVIMDRWGNLVFENEAFLSNDRSSGWNGRYNDIEAVQGVYVYIIEYTDEDGEIRFMVGSLTLLR